MAARRPRAKTRDTCTHALPHMDGDRVFMDWRTHKVDRPGPCRICRGSTGLRDCFGTRCHKVCAEAEFARDMAIAAATYGRAA